MSWRWVLRAVAAPERFLTRGGFIRFLSESGVARVRTTRGSRRPPAFGVQLPADLVAFLDALGGGSLGGFTVTAAPASFADVLAAAKRSRSGAVRLTALLASAVPLGERRAADAGREIVVCFLDDAPTRGLVAALAPARREGGPIQARLLARSVADLAVMCALRTIGEEAPPTSFSLAEGEAARALVERAGERANALLGGDARVRAAIRLLSARPLDVPPPNRAVAAPPKAGSAVDRRRGRDARTSPLALGALVEAFLREDLTAVEERIAAHATSEDDIVADTARVLGAALRGERGAVPRDLGRRRGIALRALRPRGSAASDDEARRTTESIVTHFDSLPPNAEAYAATHEREETLLALAELGHRAIAPMLVARALTGDPAAVDMLGALGDKTLVPLVVGDAGARATRPLAARAAGEPSRIKSYEAALARMLVAIGAKREARGGVLRTLLADNPLTNWRAGLERGALVRELVNAIGEVEDEGAAPLLMAILESKSQEYRPVLPDAAQALGRLHHVPALPQLERLLSSPKEQISCEAIWAVGAIGAAHLSLRESTGLILERLRTVEPGAEATRLAAIAKVREGKGAPRSTELRRAIDRALWEPAYRQEDTSRRRAWGLRALEELGAVVREQPNGRLEPATFFLGHEAIRHLVTRDDHRVRRAAERAFAAWALPIPAVRRYYAFALPALEAHGGLDALLEAVRDPLGVFRHNVATRLRAIGDRRAVRPLAEATARLFAEPPTSTYEYDDAPPHLVAFVRALAYLNAPEGNEVLIEGLRSENHQVRAVVAENAPDDERFVPELMAMLGDPRSFLRSRAEKSLTSLGALPPAATIDPNTNEVALARRIEG